MSKKSEEYLESKRCDFDLITVDHAKTYGKIVELEKDLNYWKDFLNFYNSKSNSAKVLKLESEIERLMKL